ncbi:hypothetical protein ABZ208_17300 [Streptomyces sp. NPDC006208]|uniref:hypothetical protein n=1 Tax=Streptomyces sp. NPDC006208 TaxID=3156734 RepID=UPI0033AA6A45
MSQTESGDLRALMLTVVVVDRHRSLWGIHGRPRRPGVLAGQAPKPEKAAAMKTSSRKKEAS